MQLNSELLAITLLFVINLYSIYANDHVNCLDKLRDNFRDACATLDKRLSDERRMKQHTNKFKRSYNDRINEIWNDNDENDNEEKYGIPLVRVRKADFPKHSYFLLEHNLAKILHEEDNGYKILTHKKHDYGKSYRKNRGKVSSHHSGTTNSLSNSKHFRRKRTIACCTDNNCRLNYCDSY